MSGLQNDVKARCACQKWALHTPCNIVKGTPQQALEKCIRHRNPAIYIVKHRQSASLTVPSFRAWSLEGNPLSAGQGRPQCVGDEEVCRSSSSNALWKWLPPDTIGQAYPSRQQAQHPEPAPEQYCTRMWTRNGALFTRPSHDENMERSCRLQRAYVAYLAQTSCILKRNSTQFVRCTVPKVVSSRTLHLR